MSSLMVYSMKCTVFISEIPDTSQKFDCPPPKNYIFLFFVNSIQRQNFRVQYGKYCSFQGKNLQNKYQKFYQFV